MKTRKYQKTLKEYALIYAKNLSTLKRWSVLGYPLDDPDAMQEYFSSKGRKPDAEREEPLTVGPESPQEGTCHWPDGLDREGFTAGDGALAAIARLEMAEQERAASFFDAVRRDLPSTTIKNRLAEWVSIIEVLRKLAKDEPEIRRREDRTIDRSEMDAAVGHIFALFRGVAKNLPTTAATKLLAAQTREDFVTILNGEVEVLLRTLSAIAVAEAENA